MMNRERTDHCMNAAAIQVAPILRHQIKGPGLQPRRM